MTNPLDELREKYWINVYHSDKENAPICNLVFVNKENKEEKYKYPVWKDKEKDGYGYVGKLDTYKVESNDGFNAQDREENTIPF